MPHKIYRLLLSSFCTNRHVQLFDIKTRNSSLDSTSLKNYCGYSSKTVHLRGAVRKEKHDE